MILSPTVSRLFEAEQRIVNPRCPIHGTRASHRLAKRRGYSPRNRGLVRPGSFHAMAAGDQMLDASGNVILDSSGNVLLDDGAGNSCCCGGTLYNCCGCSSGRGLPSTLGVSISGTTNQYPGPCTIGGPTEVVSGNLDGTYTITNSSGSPCFWQYANSNGPVTVDQYDGLCTTILDVYAKILITLGASGGFYALTLGAPNTSGPDSGGISSLDQFEISASSTAWLNFCCGVTNTVTIPCVRPCPDFSGFSAFCGGTCVLTS